MTRLLGNLTKWRLRKRLPGSGSGCGTLQFQQTKSSPFANGIAIGVETLNLDRMSGFRKAGQAGLFA
jgi:hypothetical protein